MKTCTKCKETKSLDKFYKETAKEDGHQFHCISCDKKMKWLYYHKYGRKSLREKIIEKIGSFSLNYTGGFKE